METGTIRKILIGLSAGAALLFGTASTFAADGFGVGVALSATNTNASGTETEGTKYSGFTNVLEYATILYNDFKTSKQCVL